MPLREIIQVEHPTLRRKAAQVKDFGPPLQTLIDDMIETMHAAQGIGLAAPQIGLPIQMAVVDVAHDPECITYLKVDGEHKELADIMPLIFVNPELEFGDEKDVMNEGCLSIPDLRADVTRPEQLTAKLTLLDGSRVTIETDGLLGRAIQHEVDHLNGVLFIDRLKPTAKNRLRTSLKRMQQEYKERQRRKQWKK